MFSILLRCLTEYIATRSAPDYRNMLPYREVLKRTGCECIEATVCSSDSDTQ